jgi:hypothetical protein
MARNNWEVSTTVVDGKPVVTLEADGNPLTEADMINLSAILLNAVRDRRWRAAGARRRARADSKAA